MNGENKISFDNIQRVPIDKFENDFSFIINEKIYNTNKFVASILSPKISRLLQENMNISYFRINTEFEGDFNQLIQYGEMKEINIKEEENQYFRSIMKELGNINEFLRFSKELQDDISYENVFKRIQLKTELHSNFDEEITFISSNFHDFCDKYPKEIFDLDVNIIEQIISNNKLKILNEKELFDIVLTFYIKSKEYSILFSYINFLNLPRKCIQEFKEKFDINDLNISIWENICSRLEQDISNESIKVYRNSDQETKTTNNNSDSAPEFEISHNDDDDDIEFVDDIDENKDDQKKEEEEDDDDINIEIDDGNSNEENSVDDNLDIEIDDDF